MTALARQSVALERAFQLLLRVAYQRLAELETRLGKADNIIDASAIREAIRITRAAIAAAEAV